jgi:hypothetical protein
MREIGRERSVPNLHEIRSTRDDELALVHEVVTERVAREAWIDGPLRLRSQIPHLNKINKIIGEKDKKESTFKTEL